MGVWRGPAHEGKDISCANCGFVLANEAPTPISPVSSILHTNCIPTDSETVQILQVVQEVEPEITRLEREISRAKDVLMKLEMKHWELRKFQSDHWALPTPARHLIPEILSEIFIQCLPDPSFDGPWNSPWETPEDTLLSLGQICSSWRMVALSTPKL